MKTSVVLTNDTCTSNFTTTLSPSLDLSEDREYEAALLSINLYNSIPNITEENNTFKYSTDKGSTWKTISLEKGSYELEAINDEIQKQMIEKGDYDANNNEPYITISAHISQLRSIIHISNISYLIDFNTENSIGSVLGFKNIIIGYGHSKSQDIVNITQINLVLVNTDIISGSYVKGSMSSAIYAYDPNKVSPGYKIEEKPNPSLIYYSVNRKKIHDIRVWLTDIHNNPVDLRCEEVIVILHIKEVENVEHQIVNAIKKLFPNI